MDPVSALSIAAATAQFIEQTIKVVKGLLDYWHAVKDAPKNSRELQKEVVLVSDILLDFQTALTSTPKRTKNMPKTGALMDTAAEFGVVMTEMAKRIEVKSAERFKRLKWPFDQAENEKYLSKLERFKNTFTLALQIIHGYYFVSLATSHGRQTLQEINNQVYRIGYIVQDSHEMNLGIFLYEYSE